MQRVVTENQLSMAGRAIDFWIDFQLFRPFGVILFRVFNFQIQLRYQIWIANRKLTGFRVLTVAIKAPLHRHRLNLSDHFHLVDSTVTGNATDTFVDVGTVVEVNEVRQIVDSLPWNGFARLQTFANRTEQCAFRVDDAKRTTVGRGSISTVAIAACCGRRDSRMAGFLDRVVAVTTVHLQLASVQFVTERNWLLRLMAYVNDRRMDRREQTGRQVTTDCQRSDGRQSGKFINPSGKVELLHRDSPEFRACENRPLKLEKPELDRPTKQPKSLLSSGNAYTLNRRI